MNMSGRRILKTTAAVVGISALGALGSGTAFAATPTHLGDAPMTHGTSAADATDLAARASSRSDELHTFAVPKMDTHVAEPTTRYNDDSDYSDNNDDSDNNDSGYRYNNSRYNDDNDYRYNDYNDDNGYYYNGRWHDRNDNGLLGGGLLGGND